MVYDFVSSVGLVLVFLHRPGLRAAPTLWALLSSCLLVIDDRRGRHAYLSDEDAIKFAICEYLHVDCRLMHARQWGRVRSHCRPSQQSRVPELVMHVTERRDICRLRFYKRHSLWSCARRIPHSSTLACSAFAFSVVVDQFLARCHRETSTAAHRP
jgi:hypothetical protein